MLIDGKKLDGRYLVQAEIGSGGFGAVYLAQDTRFGGNNRVAIKQILLNNESATKAFRSEADLLYNLSHPNLPKVTNCFQEDGSNYIVMDYISGEDLSQMRMRGRQFSIDETLAIADTVLDALEYLHSFLIFHRDIKPQNIKINEQGKIFLLDFGTAKGNFDETTLTQIGQSITGFTPFYAPLEQVLRVDPNSFLLLKSLESPQLEDFLHRKTDERSDIYSLGATLYFLLTNFSPEKATATIRAFSLWSDKADPLPPCQTINAAIPDDLASALHRSLAIEPENRFQTAAEFRRALRGGASAGNSIPKISELMTVSLTDIKVGTSMEATALMSSQPAPPVRTIGERQETAAPVENTTAELPIKTAAPQKSKTPLYGALLLIGFLFLGGVGAWLALRGSASPSSSPSQTKDAPAAKPSETVQPPLAANSRSLIYSLLVQKMRGKEKYQEPFESSGQEIFESGYQFQMRLTPPDAGYLYTFSEGLDEQGKTIYQIQFPTPIQNNGSAQIVGDRLYELGWNQFDGAPGTENFWIVWSAAQPEAAERARADAFQNKGVVTDADAQKQLKEYLDALGKNRTSVTKETERKLTMVSFEGDAVAYLLRLEHR